MLASRFANVWPTGGLVLDLACGRKCRSSWNVQIAVATGHQQRDMRTWGDQKETEVILFPEI